MPSEFERRSELGVKYYQQGRYRDALTEWLAAYAIEQHPTLLLNIGQANLQLEQPAEAIRYYVMFLQAKPAGKQPGKQFQLAQAGLEKARAMEAEQQKKAMEEAQRQHEAREAAARQAAAQELLVKLTASQPSPPRTPPEKPLYKKPWFWGIIGGIAVAGLVIGLGVGLRPSNVMYPDDLIK